LPFTIQGPASDAKAQMAYNDLAKKVASCVGDKLKKKAEDIVRPRAKKEIKKIEDAAAQKIKDIFQGR
jgi:hypothetical protein